MMTDAPDETPLAEAFPDALGIFDLCEWLERETGHYPMEAELYALQTVGDARRWIDRHRVTV